MRDADLGSQVVLDVDGLADAADTPHAQEHRTAAQALYKLAQLHVITPLSGTTNETHMTEDVAVDKIDLSAEDDRIRTLLAWMGLP